MARMECCQLCKLYYEPCEMRLHTKANGERVVACADCRGKTPSGSLYAIIDVLARTETWSSRRARIEQERRESVENYKRARYKI